MEITALQQSGQEYKTESVKYSEIQAEMLSELGRLLEEYQVPEDRRE